MSDETSALVGFTRGRGGWLRRRGWSVAPSKAAIVEALGEKDDIGYRVVDGENDLGDELI
jgi:hypothetical protein